MKNKIAFLFGAGISDPSGILGISTNDLTEKILGGGNIYRDGSGKYYYNEYGKYNLDGGREYVERIKKLFSILRNYFSDHYSFFDREINYEDYYYLIDSIHKDEWGEIENPVVTYFSDTLFKIHALLFEPVYSGYSSLRLIDLTREALNYIKDLVVYSLNKSPENLNQLSFLKNLVVDQDFDKAFIFILNHDTFVEQYFLKEKIESIDGFVTQENSIKFWSPESYNNDLKMNIFKLHGSIDWEIFDTSDSYKRKACIYKKPKRGASEPLITIGRFNKLNEYSRGINFELQCLFWKYLNECERLVITGYSFGDQGINSRIINWLYKAHTNKMVIIHKNDEVLLKSARLAISNNWNRWIKNDTLRVIPEWIQDTNWEEIKKKLT